MRKHFKIALFKLIAHKRQIPPAAGKLVRDQAPPTVWQFTTVAPPPTGAPYSLFLDTDIPATPAWADNGPISVGIKFSSNQSGSVTAVKFYAGPGNNGPYNVDIWAADGTKLGTGRAFGNASGWKTVLLDAPVAITAGNTMAIDQWVAAKARAVSAAAAVIEHGDPQGFAAFTSNFGDWARHLLSELGWLRASTGDAALAALADEVAAYPNVAALLAADATPPRSQPALLLSCVFALGDQRLSLFTKRAAIGAPYDVTLAELTVELFYPADEATERALRDGVSNGS